ncbi:MAG: glycosyltransferase [Bacteroides sp.]|nr:glycosyltransferase [Bacteroides sp.]MCM1390169.1 glycosyltransferase [Bacteroides sp.]
MVQYKRLEFRFITEHQLKIEMTPPKVSIIVATYNQEGTIARTLDSILAQEGDFDYEIIIGEDCSTDRTAEICKEYATKYPQKIKLLLNNPNKGLLDNYFDCILAATGDYIADCAGDDCWIDNRKLDKQRRILDSDNSIVMVHTGWNYYNESTGATTPFQLNKSKYHQPVMEKGSLFLPVLRRDDAPIVHLCTAMYRRESFMKIYAEDHHLFRGKEFTCEDLQIITALSREGRIAYIPDITLNYSISDHSISSPKDAAKTFDYYLGTLKLTRYIQQKYNVPDKELNNYYRTDIHYIITRAFNSGDWQRCLIGKNLAKEYGVALKNKSRILTAISSIAIIRDIALNLKRALS